jgi:hypothetical protein
MISTPGVPAERRQPGDVEDPVSVAAAVEAH